MTERKEGRKKMKAFVLYYFKIFKKDNNFLFLSIYSRFENLETDTLKIKKMIEILVPSKTLKLLVLVHILHIFINIITLHHNCHL